MNSSVLNGLLGGVNQSVSPSFSWGCPVPTAATFAAKLACKATFPVLDAERALTLLCAELTGLRWEKEIFRAEVPEHLDSGFCVAFEHEQPCSDPDYRMFIACFSGKRILRDSILERAALLTGKLPLPEIVKINSDKQSNAVIFAEITPAKQEYGIGTEAGRVLYTSGVRLKVLCRTN